MHLDHIAIWTNDIDRLEQFYVKYFAAVAAPRYSNPVKGFQSLFLSLDQGSRIEIMKTTRLSPLEINPGIQRMGLTHFAISVGSESGVDQLVSRLNADGYPVLDGPRLTGDGYYECVILDPDGNRLEISA